MCEVYVSFMKTHLQTPPQNDTRAHKHRFTNTLKHLHTLTHVLVFVDARAHIQTHTQTGVLVYANANTLYTVHMT